MARIDEIKSLFDILYNMNLSMDEEIPEIAIEDKEKIVQFIDLAKAEVERLHILRIMDKVCK